MRPGLGSRETTTRQKNILVSLIGLRVYPIEFDIDQSRHRTEICDQLLERRS